MKTDEAVACRAWLVQAVGRGYSIVVPEIADYELRRELLRAGKIRGLRHLDDLIRRVDYLPVSTAAMRKAAELWAEVRNAGQPTAANTALDGDVILAAQTITAFSDNAIVATTNVEHQSRLVRAELWMRVS